MALSYAQASYYTASFPADGPETYLLILAIFALFVVAIVWLVGGFEPCPKNPFPKDGLKGDIENFFAQPIANATNGRVVAASEIEAVRKSVINKLKSEGVIS